MLKFQQGNNTGLIENIDVKDEKEFLIGKIYLNKAVGYWKFITIKSAQDFEPNSLKEIVDKIDNLNRDVINFEKGLSGEILMKNTKNLIIGYLAYNKSNSEWGIKSVMNGETLNFKQLTKIAEKIQDLNIPF